MSGEQTPDRLISGEPTEEDRLQASLRPQRLEDFIGQPEVRANLKVFIEAAKMRGEALSHCLFYGPPGLGKTTLSQIIAKEMGVGFRETSGPVIAKAGDLAAILTNLQPHDVLFIDEIHRLDTRVAEILYPAMEDFQLDLMIGEGPAARSVRIDLPPFTLVGATTRSGLLDPPFLARFGIQTALNFYSVDDLSLIVKRSARLLDLAIDESGAREVASRSRGTPRVAGRLLARVRDFAMVEGAALVTAEAADRALRRLNVDQAGLDIMDQRYLTLLATNYGGGPVGVDTIAAALAEQRDMVERTIEPYLLQQGYLLRTPRGRMLARRGWTHLGLTPPDAPAAPPVDLFDPGEDPT